MVSIEVSCPMSDCQRIFDYECADEAATDGSEHKAECSFCGREIHFEIACTPMAVHETYRG